MQRLVREGHAGAAGAAADPAALLIALRVLESLHCLLLLPAFCALVMVEHPVA